MLHNSLWYTICELSHIKQSSCVMLSSPNGLVLKRYLTIEDRIWIDCKFEKDCVVINLLKIGRLCRDNLKVTITCVTLIVQLSVLSQSVCSTYGTKIISEKY